MQTLQSHHTFVHQPGGAVQCSIATRVDKLCMQMGAIEVEVEELRKTLAGMGKEGQAAQTEAEEVRSDDCEDEFCDDYSDPDDEHRGTQAMDMDSLGELLGTGQSDEPIKPQSVAVAEGAPAAPATMEANPEHSIMTDMENKDTDRTCFYNKYGVTWAQAKVKAAELAAHDPTYHSTFLCWYRKMTMEVKPKHSITTDNDIDMKDSAG